MSRFLLLAVCALVLRCASASAGCGPCELAPVPRAAELRQVANGADLEQRVGDVLAALAACETTSDAFAAAGMERPEESNQLPLDHARRCMEVVRWTVETPTVVAFELAPRCPGWRPGAAEFLMYASHVDGRWRFTWPAALGPAQMSP